MIGTNFLESFFRKIISRKEVIHPQLPLRMPCYDFTLITDPTFVPVRSLRVLPTFVV